MALASGAHGIGYAVSTPGMPSVHLARVGAERFERLDLTATRAGGEWIVGGQVVTRGEDGRV
ncbi:MAG: hypothetical protein IPK52_21585 [Chloroflexi bacterium]|nr:hypothetical protein [Chloroflexota bacterium]